MVSQNQPKDSSSIKGFCYKVSFKPLSVFHIVMVYSAIKRID